MTNLNCVFIVRSCEYLLYDQLPCPSDYDRVVPEIGVFEQNPAIFFMDADSILDCVKTTSTTWKVSIEVMN